MNRTLTAQEAISRFEANEARVNAFVNEEGTYATNTDPCLEVRTLPSFMEELRGRYLNVVLQGEWQSGADYAMNDLVKCEDAYYLAVEPHRSGPGFADDLAGQKWVVYSGGGTLSDALDGQGTAEEGIGASEWALARAYAAAEAAGNGVRGLLANNGAGPKLRADILPGYNSAWSATVTESGVITYPYSGYYLEEVQAGGGGTGALETPTCCALGGGASSGEYRWRVVYREAAEIDTATVGAGGIGAVVPGATGGNGGDTSLGSAFTALGGLGARGIVLGSGNSTVVAFEQAQSSGPALSQAGSPGAITQFSSYNAVATGTMNIYRVQSGKGGDSQMGAGGQMSFCALNANSTYTANGTDGQGYGAGAGGAISWKSSEIAVGGKGAPGCVKITFLGV